MIILGDAPTSLGLHLGEAGQPDEALAAFQEAVGTLRACARDDPGLDLAPALGALGAQLVEAVEIHHRHVEAADENLRAICAALAVTLEALGNTAGAG
ncbi:hypothetical protein CLV72_103339 [Allonocardiopsis opalescens]|uniref:Tetratricopeptide repeat protein n=2 Tax=Allonocardiopsis opalescens TaxID=1144618 RepID=A0A2T0Q7G4_9ACTN|nr:hypothetical protein CLV72_103339 [Allonocardiopsis opalescens]